MSFFEWFYAPFFWFTREVIDLRGWAEANNDWEGYGFGLGLMFLLYNVLLVIILMWAIGFAHDVVRWVKRERRAHGSLLQGFLDAEAEAARANAEAKGLRDMRRRLRHSARSDDGAYARERNGPVDDAYRAKTQLIREALEHNSLGQHPIGIRGTWKGMEEAERRRAAVDELNRAQAERARRKQEDQS